VARSEPVQRLWLPLARAQATTQQRFAERAQLRGDVALTDLHDAPLTFSGKFVVYDLLPSAIYSVTLVRMRQHYKLSVGYNPWAHAPRRHDLAALCRRHGGGGHPGVAAISVPPKELERARRIARDLVDELNQS